MPSGLTIYREKGTCAAPRAASSQSAIVLQNTLQTNKGAESGSVAQSDIVDTHHIVENDQMHINGIYTALVAVV